MSVRPAIRRAAIAAAIVLLLLGCYAGVVLWRTALRFRQVRNCADLQTLAARIESFKERHGTYPVILAQAISASASSRGTDAWGAPWVYSRTAKGFVLVSYGRDGRRDAQHLTCENLDADVYADEAGVERCCGK
jgi:hypothetical protein